MSSLENLGKLANEKNVQNDCHERPKKNRSQTDVGLRPIILAWHHLILIMTFLFWINDGEAPLLPCYNSSKY